MAYSILPGLGVPLLALSSGSLRMYGKSTDKLLCEVCSLSLFYGLKLQLILFLMVLLSLPIPTLGRTMYENIIHQPFHRNLNIQVLVSSK